MMQPSISEHRTAAPAANPYRVGLAPRTAVGTADRPAGRPVPATLAVSVALALALTIVLPGTFAAAEQAASQPNRLHVSVATFLGDWEGNEAGGVAISPGGHVVFAGRVPAAHHPDGLRPVNLLGGGDGAIVRFDASGVRPLAITRLPDPVRDVTIADDGRIIVAAGAGGVIVLDADASRVLWRDEQVSAIRVAVSEGGRIVALTADKQVRIYQRGGDLIDTRRFGDGFVTDVAIDDRSGQVFVTGFNNRHLRPRPPRGRWPVQVAFIRAFAIDNLRGSATWVNYDWPGNLLGGPQPGDEHPSRYHHLEADTRGYRLAMGRDGMLYFAGESAGGNSIFNRDPRELGRSLARNEENFTIDRHTIPYGTQANHITAFARYHPDTGKLDRLQWAIPRLINDRGNTMRPRGIAADEEGRVYLTGHAAHHIANRGDIWINDTLVHPEHGNGAFLMITSPDWRSRETWVVFGEGGTGVGIDVRGDHYALTAEATGQLVTSADAPYDGETRPNAYLVVGQRSAASAADQEEQ